VASPERVSVGRKDLCRERTEVQTGSNLWCADTDRRRHSARSGAPCRLTRVRKTAAGWPDRSSTPSSRSARRLDAAGTHLAIPSLHASCDLNGIGQERAPTLGPTSWCLRSLSIMFWWNDQEPGDAPNDGVMTLDDRASRAAQRRHRLGLGGLARSLQ
jgi:hypothetical protein